jgi:hypothetical protein
VEDTVPVRQDTVMMERLVSGTYIVAPSAEETGGTLRLGGVIPVALDQICMENTTMNSRGLFRL